ncbi:MAG: nucleotidyltransferase/DNA polymerase involved in DNA repair [Haloquadratum walsbyi J07HQW1]|jgi:Nucleotidyltransferase/DNA polymerase involved in DNA repair|uniref:DNA polymerase IV n=1 Tax=Haloquadratum walsbyi J07HQW1 TaxID=1238424 RepID=U1PMI8_9EURY|nr:MAG: nucleotidyltransferase/DNA polymerase involved in DNA repair [Haloquadratum walsbyi J07HQW1]
MRGKTLPGTDTSTDTPDQIILHVDMDCFYASCERLREPVLRDAPVVIGMGYEPGETFGAVATASYEAREHGIESAQSISHALEQLPRADAHNQNQTAPDKTDAGTGSEGYYRPVDLEYYQSVAAEVKDILHDCADVVREVSIDEAYLDITGRTTWQRTNGGDRTLAEGYARYVKQRIMRTVGVPASVGVAPNMSAAKIASDHQKPDGLVVLEPGSVASFLNPLPVESIHGVGPVTANRLSELEIRTAGDLAAADSERLTEVLDSRAETLSKRAMGNDDRDVTPTGKPQSLSRESAFAATTENKAQKQNAISELAADVAARANQRGALYQTIGIKVVTPPYEVRTRERSLPGPIEDSDLVVDIACELLAEFEEEAARKIGVRVSNLSFAAADQAQLNAREWDSDRSCAPAPAVDDIQDDSHDIDNANHHPHRSHSSGQASLEEFTTKHD